jgi:hypothetical protein
VWRSIRYSCRPGCKYTHLVLVCSRYSHRWARLLKQQTLITVYHLPTKENKIPFSFCRKQMEGYSFHFPFAANKQNVSFSINTVFHMYIFIYIYVETAAYMYISISIYICCHFRRKTEAQMIFLNLFTVCSLCKQKFVVCPLVYKETNGCYLFANGLKGLNGLAHLCVFRRRMDAHLTLIVTILSSYPALH